MSKETLEAMSLDTLLIHGGHRPDPATRALAAPIYQTATYGFDTVDDMNSSWDRTGLVYSREGSPTVYALEEKLALLDAYAKLAMAEEEVRGGKTVDARTALQGLRAKHGL